MNPFTKLEIFKHFAGTGTVSGIYVCQVIHINELIGLTALSFVYMYTLLVYHTIVYGTESGLFLFKDDRGKSQLFWLKVAMILAAVSIATFLFLHTSTSPGNDHLLIIVRTAFTVFGTLFPEFLLPVIFGIRNLP